MMAAVEDSTSFRFSTDSLPARARRKAVRALCEHPMLPTRLEPLDPLPDSSTRVDVTQTALPGLAILSGRLCGLRQHVRPERSLQRGADDLFFGMNLAGASAAHQCGREITLHGGDAFFAYRGKTGFTVNRPRQVRFVGLRVSRSALAPLVTDLEVRRSV